MVDWCAPAVVDALWRRLGSLEGLFVLYSDVDTALRTCSLLRMVSRDVRGTPASLYHAVGRPYLSHMHGTEAMWGVRFELAARRLVSSALATLRLVGVDQATFAGGFAAWELERALEAWRGQDGFPRATRGTSVYSAWYPRAYMWLPGDLDLFFACDDPLLVHDVLRPCYEQYVRDIYGDGTATVMLDDPDDEYAEDTEMVDDSREGRVAAVRTWLEHVGMPETMRAQCLHFVPHAAPPPPHILSVCGYRCSIPHPFFPTRLHIVRTTTCPPALEEEKAVEGRYAAWVVERFDLAHCAVTLGVDGATGAWRFGAHPTACDALMRRKLVPTVHCFARLCGCAGSVGRLEKYVYRGFSLEGDEHWPDPHEAEKAMRAVVAGGL